MTYLTGSLLFWPPSRFYFLTFILHFIHPVHKEIMGDFYQNKIDEYIKTKSATEQLWKSKSHLQCVVFFPSNTTSKISFSIGPLESFQVFRIPGKKHLSQKGFLLKILISPLPYQTFSRTHGEKERDRKKYLFRKLLSPGVFILFFKAA